MRGRQHAESPTPHRTSTFDEANQHDLLVKIVTGYVLRFSKLHDNAVK